MCAYICVFVCVCVFYMCMGVCMCMCVCVLGREGSWVFASTALVVAWTAMYLTEPFSPPYRCHTNLKNVYYNHWLQFKYDIFERRLSKSVTCTYMGLQTSLSAAAATWKG